MLLCCAALSRERTLAASTPTAPEGIRRGGEAVAALRRSWKAAQGAKKGGFEARIACGFLGRADGLFYLHRPATAQDTLRGFGLGGSLGTVFRWLNYLD